MKSLTFAPGLDEGWEFLLIAVPLQPCVEALLGKGHIVISLD